MTSANVASNDFLAVLNEQRVQANKNIANPSTGALVPMAEIQALQEQLGSLPVSNSDALDDDLQKIKAVAHSGATVLAEQAQEEITDITNRYMNSARDNDAYSLFRNKMEQCREHARENADIAIDKVFDTAQNVGQNSNPSVQSAIINFMTSVVEPGISAVLNEILNFIANAVENLPNWIAHAFDAIKQTFAKITAFIKSAF
ncbi:hypothetical protein [Pseudomonas sp. FP198]|uniref:hypothetical protein n=1 Tax=Pseudomonas sp. FP198 TaxID=2954084 RepID=UPI00273267F0|nr:hypothetical protein [Pseudomonas sp. FP198]WLG93844.1 hypothetical protein PSH78_15655 [Pseudomonas sp. FP198]